MKWFKLFPWEIPHIENLRAKDNYLTEEEKQELEDIVDDCIREVQIETKEEITNNQIYIVALENKKQMLDNQDAMIKIKDEMKALNDEVVKLKRAVRSKWKLIILVFIIAGISFYTLAVYEHKHIKPFFGEILKEVAKRVDIGA